MLVSVVKHFNYILSDLKIQCTNQQNSWFIHDELIDNVSTVC